MILEKKSVTRFTTAKQGLKSGFRILAFLLPASFNITQFRVKTQGIFLQTSSCSNKLLMCGIITD